MALLLGEERVARLARLWMWAAELLSRLGEDQYVGLVLSRKRMETWMVWCSGQRLQEVVQFVCGLPASKLAQTQPPTLLQTGNAALDHAPVLCLSLSLYSQAHPGRVPAGRGTAALHAVLLQFPEIYLSMESRHSATQK